LAAHHLMPFTEIGFFGTTRNEFFVTLRKSENRYIGSLEERRLDYLKGILLDIREQTDYLIDGSNYVGPARN
jgi:hypothetical protein